MNPPTDLKTPAQLAATYPVSRSGLYAACVDGLLPHYRIPSKSGKRGKYLISEADFLAWLESNRHEGGAGASVPLVHITPRSPSSPPPAGGRPAPRASSTRT